jgi:hypothetical protein
VNAADRAFRWGLLTLILTPWLILCLAIPVGLAFALADGGWSSIGETTARDALTVVVLFVSVYVFGPIIAIVVGCILTQGRLPRLHELQDNLRGCLFIVLALAALFVVFSVIGLVASV